MLTPRIIADLRSGDECADPDYPGLRVRRTNAARVFFYRYRASDGALGEIKLGDEGARLLRRELLSKLGDRSAAAVMRRELQDGVIRPMLNRAPRCGTYLLGRIRCAYTHAAEQGRLPDDFVFPTLGIKGAPQVRRKRVFSDSELATFVRWLPRSPYSRTVRVALALVLLTGCRSGEVVAAMWRDIDLERAVWTIRETKNGEPHDVIYPVKRSIC